MTGGISETYCSRGKTKIAGLTGKNDPGGTESNTFDRWK